MKKTLLTMILLALIFTGMAHAGEKCFSKTDTFLWTNFDMFVTVCKVARVGGARSQQAWRMVQEALDTGAAIEVPRGTPMILINRLAPEVLVVEIGGIRLIGLSEFITCGKDS